MLKLFDLLSADYRARIERGARLGRGRSQSRGHPVKGEQLVSSIAAPNFLGENVKSAVKIRQRFTTVPKSSRSIFLENGTDVHLSVVSFDVDSNYKYGIKGGKARLKSVIKGFLRSPEGRHRLYRLVYTVSITKEGSNKLTGQKDKNGNDVAIDSSAFEELGGFTNIDRLLDYIVYAGGPLQTLSFDFKD